MTFKIFDIGGSFFKVCDSDGKSTQYSLPSTGVLNVDDIKRLIRDNIDDSTEYIGLSSQMHGFVAFNGTKQITDFVTWKTTSSYVLDDPVFDDFSRTGLQKRSDLPINNLYNILRDIEPSLERVRFMNITEAVLDVCNQMTHVTMACGSGFYDISTRTYISEYIDFFKQRLGVTLIFDTIVSRLCISGYMNVNGRLVPVYTGIGDFQASVFGCNVVPKMLYINMSTGSQVALIKSTPFVSNSLSCRPFFNDTFLHCYTHIPCGRVWANIHSKLEFDLWEVLASITEDMFYHSNKSIPFCDGSFTRDDILPLFRGFIAQYLDIVRKLELDSIFLSGGIPKKIPLIKRIFEREFGVVYQHIGDDDSIRGIQLLLQTIKEKSD